MITRKDFPRKNSSNPLGISCETDALKGFAEGWGWGGACDPAMGLSISSITGNYWGTGEG